MKSKKVRLSWIILLLPLIWGVVTVYQFADIWLRLAPQPKEIQPTLNAVYQRSTTWVNLPMGELFWHIYGIDQNFKIANAFHPWNLRDREIPPATLTAERASPRLTTANVYATINGIALSKKPEVYYSAVKSTSKKVTPCTASATGGAIAVLCETDESGTLSVYEHSWSGWTAWVDGMRAQLVPGEWLAVKLSPGKHRINFSYLPWDVPLGLIISLVGVGMAMGLWRKKN